MPSKDAALVDLLVSLFSASELRRFLRYNVQADLSAELPGDGASLMNLADTAVQALVRHGLVDGAFFDALLRERAGRRADIDGVRGQWTSRDIGGPPSGDAPGPISTPSTTTVDPGAQEAAARILFLASNPAGTSRLALDKEFRRVSQALLGSVHRDEVELDQWPDVHLTDLPRQLRRYLPRVVHFSGHGDTGGRLVMKNGDGQAQPMEPGALASLLGRRSETIKLVVLNACHSQDLAQALAQRIDCVVGTSDAIDDGAAVTFAEIFYGALWDGASVQDAYLDAKDVVGGMLPGKEDVLQLLPREGVDPGVLFLVDRGA